MNKNQIVEYVDILFKAALSKCGNIVDAQDLVQDTVLAALAALGKAEIENPEAWLITVLNRRYYDMLRRKYHKPTVCFDVLAEVPASGGEYDRIEESEEYEHVRRCLSYLTELYREVMVRYYMHGEKVKEIAAALGISENTVKSRLDAGRKRIRKEFMMENYVKQSYEPDILHIASSGRNGLDGEPFSLVGKDRIAMNLLILAYDRPISVTELAKAIGIPMAYLEPVITRLIDGGLLKRTGDKVYTDFIIYTDLDRKSSFDLEKQLAESLYKEIWTVMEKGFEELHGSTCYGRQSASKQVKLDSFFAVRTMQNAVNNVRDEACGGPLPFEEYPERPNGGKWFAMGACYPAHYDFGAPDNECEKYSISGESKSSQTVKCIQTKRQNLTICEYDTLLGRTQLGMRGGLKRPMEDVDIGQVLYAIDCGREETLPMISADCFDNFEIFIESRYLARENGKIVCDIPVLSDEERFWLYELSERIDRLIAGQFHDEFMKLMKNPVKLPPHLKSVPEWLRRMLCCAALPMLVIEKAKDNGMFPQCANYPAPAILISVREA